MKELTQLESTQVSGGVARNYLVLAGGGIGGVTSNGIQNALRGEKMSVTGVITSFATGLFLGGAAGAAVGAAGGGLAGTVAWAPGFWGLNQLIQNIIAAND